MSFFRDLIDRRMFRYVVAYAAASWAVLEVVDQLVGNEVLPPLVYSGALTLVLCGFPGALIVSWFHGKKGRQEIPLIERWLLGIVAVFALGTTGFVARVSTDPAAAGGRAALAPTEDPSRVAVLYMDARGGDDAEFLASGLTETLIDQLSAVEGIHVISRNGSQLFRGAAAPADSVGRTLQVGSLVGGTVAVAGDRVQVDIVLTSARDGSQIAQRRLQRPRTEIFALQDELADTVAVFLRRAIGQELGARTLRAATSSQRAWELVQQAGQTARAASQVAAHDLQAAERGLNEADSLLVLAEREDPTWLAPVLRRGWNAFALARLGGLDRVHNERWLGRALEHADRAVAAGPTDPGALELRGTILYWHYLLNLAGTPEESHKFYHDAEQQFRGAIAAAGGRLASAQNALSHMLLNKGELAEAKLNALQAYTLDPFLENANLTLWRIFVASWGLGDAVEAQRYCDEGGRRFPDFYRFQECQLMLAALPGMKTDFARLWQVLHQFEAASPPPVQEVNRRLGTLYLAAGLARSGLPDSARALARSARASAAIDPVRELAHVEAMVWVAIGDKQEAVKQLQVYLTANPQVLDGLRRDAQRGELHWYLEPLLDEPAFRSLVGLR